MRFVCQILATFDVLLRTPFKTNWLEGSTETEVILENNSVKTGDKNKDINFRKNGVQTFIKKLEYILNQICFVKQIKLELQQFIHYSNPRPKECYVSKY